MNEIQAQQRRRARILGALSFALSLVSLPSLAGAVYDIVIGAENMKGAIMAGLFMALILALGVFLGRLALRSHQASKRVTITEELERMVLQLARASHGEISASDIALGTRLNLEQAAEVLAVMELRGHAYSTVSTEGSRRFVFPDLRSSARQESDEERVFLDELRSSSLVDYREGVSVQGQAARADLVDYREGVSVQGQEARADLVDYREGVSRQGQEARAEEWDR
ncbi:hypothetical protein DL240_09085 [Lujinxingia litoralis]|uniref:Uncharacterized protein n=1 Tax=Lujinxingia litoralis TaxID=2211119 RepID=A0A328C8N0_9DELT|nr:hypothetical protein [Lujinxingia litoralis]RAL23030.1 hypothetical protein DL240_09085 [Lujinxingia litoralis]